MDEIEWGSALEVFIFGLGGVFICLTLLILAIRVNSTVIKKIVDKKRN